MTKTLAFRDVRVFDGSQVIPRATVVVQDGVISAVGTGNEVEVPAEAEVVDGTGRTLLPGLFDCHTHTFGPALQQALIFGVTTELDMFTDYRFVQQMKQEEAAGGGLDRADIRSSGTLATAPGGHGTEYGLPIPTLTTPDEAQAFVDARIAEGSDYIKIIIEGGKVIGRPVPTLDKQTVAALVQAAHQRGKLAIVHIMTYEDARDAIEVGADALAHLFIDEMSAPDFGRFVAGHSAFVVPTLTVLEGACGTASGASLVTDNALAPYLSAEDASELKSAFPSGHSSTHASYAVAQEALRLLKVAGVPILAGTDAPNPGTLHGASIHRELELLVQAGLSPLEALTAATSLPAAQFGLDDRGRIAPGLRADLLLVEGDPTGDIQATRAIIGVWKRGTRANRQAYREAIERRKAETQGRAAPAGSESGLISDFEDGTLHTAFGYGWQVITDHVRGGTSTAEIQVVPEGANGGKGSLLIRGEIASQQMQMISMAGAAFFPGPAPFAPANLSAKQAISFWARGDGKTYRVMLFAGSMMTMPAIVSFPTSPDWQQFRFPFAQFHSADGHDILGICFIGGPEPGPFSFQIDDVRVE